MKTIYDYLIVGSGLFGSVFARKMTDAGKKCLIIDKRNHLGGNVYTENKNGITIHKYGAHIFHTSNSTVWNFVNNYAKFNNFINSPMAVYKNKVYNLPFNMNTFSKLWGIITPNEAKEKIKEQIVHFENPKNLEEYALSIVGKDIYETFIKGYTYKQWNRHPKDLKPFIIKRIPLRFTYDNNYFNDHYQGIPEKGYAEMMENIIKDIPFELNVDFFEEKYHLEKISKKILFTGKLDQFHSYKYGKLEYRSLKFIDEFINIPDFQGNACVNYTEQSIPYTRIIEHKHFNNTKCDYTIITKEYPADYLEGSEAYYPINDDTNNEIYLKYKKENENFKNYLFGGRLASYKYNDMDDTILDSLKLFNKEIICSL